MEYEITKTTYDRIAHEYAQTHYDYEFWKEEYIRLVEFALRGGLVLDVGCGPGRDCAFLAKKGFKVIGIDSSNGMVEEAKKLVPGGDFRKMDMMKLEFKDEEFDVVWACASLLHLKKDDAITALGEFRRVLKRGRLLFVSLKEGSGERVVISKDGGERFYSYYTDIEFSKILETHGFEVINRLSHKSPAITPLAGATGDDVTWLSFFARKE